MTATEKYLEWAAKVDARMSDVETRIDALAARACLTGEESERLRALYKELAVIVEERNDGNHIIQSRRHE